MNDYVMFCAVCQQNQPQQRKEPMQAHLVPDVPWQVVATDLFTLEHRDYIVITDYFSNCFVVERLVRTKTYDLVDKMKKNILAFRNTRESCRTTDHTIASEEFSGCSREWNFEHTTSSPEYP